MNKALGNASYMNTDFNESHLTQTHLKEKQPKGTILSSFTHPHVVLKLV